MDSLRHVAELASKVPAEKAQKGESQKASIYAVVYELVSAAKDYRRFYDALRSYQPSVKATASVYLVSTSQTAGDILQELLHYVDPLDRVVVVGPLSVWACANLGNEVIQWMRQNIAP